MDRPLFSFFELPPSAVIEPAVKPVISLKRRTVMLVINPVPEMSVPCRVAIISVPGELIFIDYRGGSRSIYSGINDRCRNSYTYMPESDMSIDIDLGITSGSDEAGGYNGCEDE
jgi:hypothetical protein